MEKIRKLSTIEMTVLGIAHLRGPCNIYAIYKELSSSASTYHESRAGTAYSVSKRLLKFGRREQAEGEAVRISAAGEEALREWVGPPVRLKDVAFSVDLIRLRFFFLDALNIESRLKFIDSSLEGLEEFEKRAIDLIASNEEVGDYYGTLATVSLVLETRARIEWLRLARGWLKNPIAPQGSWAKEILAALTSE